MVTEVAHLGYHTDYLAGPRSYYGVLLLFHSKVQNGHELHGANLSIEIFCSVIHRVKDNSELEI